MSERMNRTSISGLSDKCVSAYSGTGHAADAGMLAEWLGSFWSSVYSDPGFVGSLQRARALRAAQLYLDLIEALDLRDRSGAPVFHRERWHPVVLRRSARNTGSGVTFRLGDGSGLLLGRDQSNDMLDDGYATLGSNRAAFKGMVIYPIEGVSAGLVSAMTCATNSIAGATAVLGRGTSFEILDGAIAIAAEDDPFTGSRKDEFAKFEIVGEPGSDPDEETVLWLSDALFDLGFVRDHLSYALGLPGKSTETCKMAVNAAWNAVSSGCSPLLLKALFACLLGLPVVETDGETVERLYRDDDGWVVVTDARVYRLGKYASPKRSVSEGAVLRRFDTLDDSVRVYPCARDSSKKALWEEFLESRDEFIKDVPAMDLPPAMFRSGVKDGFSIGWASEDVMYAGDDANGNPKLWFYMDGLEEDNAVFWRGVWDSYERNGVSMLTALPCGDAFSDGRIPEEGSVCGSVVPMDFFMRNLIGANTVVVTVRTDELSDDAPLYDPGFFGILRECVPEYVRLYVIEHCLVYDDNGDDGNGDGDGDDDGNEPFDYDDETDEYAYDWCEDEVRIGGRRGPRVSDSARSKWVASCRDEYD